MSQLRLEPAFQDADAFYAALIAAIDRAPSEREALQFVARLSLILANQVGSDGRLREALNQAEKAAQTPESRS